MLEIIRDMQAQAASFVRTAPKVSTGNDNGPTVLCLTLLSVPLRRLWSAQ